MALDALTPAQIQSYLREKVRAGRLKGGGLSPSTVHQHLQVLHKALECAVDWDLIDRNPASRASPPRVPPSWIRVLDEEATKDLLRGLRGHAVYLPCVIATVKPASGRAPRATRTTTWSSPGPAAGSRSAAWPPRTQSRCSDAEPSRSSRTVPRVELVRHRASRHASRNSDHSGVTRAPAAPTALPRGLDRPPWPSPAGSLRR
jgi:hypothetical protein